MAREYCMHMWWKAKAPTRIYMHVKGSFDRVAQHCSSSQLHNVANGVFQEGFVQDMVRSVSYRMALLSWIWVVERGSAVVRKGASACFGKRAICFEYCEGCLGFIVLGFVFQGKVSTPARKGRTAIPCMVE
jgi:hypothetical protein